MRLGHPWLVLLTVCALPVLAEPQNLAEEVAVLEQEVAALTARQQALEVERQAWQRELEAQRLIQGELFQVARQFAHEISGPLSDSLISAEAPQGARVAKALAQDKAPRLAQIRALWQAMRTELRGQGEIRRIQAQVVALNGQQHPASVIRLGPFNALYQGRYLSYSTPSHSFRELARQPTAHYQRLAAALEGGGEAVAIDPEAGKLLSLLAATPSWEERLRQGGLVGYLILGLAVVGLLLGFGRWLLLRRIALRVGRQRQDADFPRGDNPLGRLLLAVREHSEDDLEAIEHRLDQALINELHRLNWGLPLLRLLAAIAPLLGLLGTVVGMILTFQAISLHGSGDPRLIAGGISQALVTTVLGLVTAIPLLLLHTLARGSSNALGQSLESQAAALVAQRLELRQ